MHYAKQPAVTRDYLKKLEVVISKSVWNGRFQCTHQQALWTILFENITVAVRNQMQSSHPRFSCILVFAVSL